MKKVLLIIGIICSTCLFPACDNDPNLNYGSTSPLKENTDTISKKGNAQQDKAQALLIDSLTNRMKLIEGNIESVRDELSNDINNKIEQLKKEKVGLKDLLVASVVILAILVVILFVLLKKLAVSKEALDTFKKREREKFHIIVDEKISANNKKINDDLNKTIVKTLNETKMRVEKLEKGTPRIETQKPCAPQPPINKSLTPRNENEFFMTRTSEEGQFSMQLRRETKSEDTFFSFVMDKRDRTKAEYRFEPYDEGRVSYAYTYRQDIIEKVCDIEDDNYSNTGRYNCIPGKAELKDGRWVVTKRAIVKFK